VEWFLPEPGVPIRQGDILVSRDPYSGVIDEVCLVITADCDISKGKFGQQLACLRVITVKDYVAQIWAKRKLDKLIKDEAKKLREQLAKWQSQVTGKQSTLTEDAARIWIARTEPPAICDALGVPDDGSRKKLLKVLAKYRDAFGGLDSPGDPLTMFVTFKSKIDETDSKTCRQKTLQQAQQESLPEDVFLLPILPLATDTPCVVMLREIVGVSNDLVCFRATDATSSDHFLRVCRLEPTYKYAVSQAFGILYSRIGMPDEYERRCKNVVTGIAFFEWE
jgi:hypothetical protein